MKILRLKPFGNDNYFVVDAQATTIVTIPGLGQVSGLIKTFEHKSNMSYYQYKAMPYANPVERFELARPKSPWNRIHDGTKEGPLCPQVFDFFMKEDERNCLRLTVTTPQDPNNLLTQLPVLVFIFGGLFIAGNIRTSTYDPEMLVQEGIVVVQIQYRLGPTAWVTDGHIIPKNIGLKDMRLGLEFVQKYITSFGGDPTKVTVYGESAGAISASFLWQSPRTNHIFRAAYFQSGSSLNVLSLQHDPVIAFRRILQKGPCIVTLWGTPKQQVDCLKLLPAKLLLIASYLSFVWDDAVQLEVFSGLTSSVVLEDPSDPEAIVIENPLKQLTNGTIPNIPVLHAINSEEAIVFQSVVNFGRFRSSKKFVPKGMQVADPNAVGKAIKIHYGGSEFGFNFLPARELIRVVSDITFNNPFRKFIELTHSKMSPGAVYCMQFSYVSAMGPFNKWGMVSHLEDLFYIWNMGDMSWQKKLRRPFITPEAHQKQRQIIRMVANFVKFLNPTPENDPDLDGFKWPAVTNSSYVECLNFDKKLSVLVNPKNENYLFWNHTYYNYGNPSTTF